MLLQPKNWAVFQHYKDRCPPWIKLHRDLLNDRVYMRLPIASKALAPLLWLLASESKDGIFDGSLDELVFRLHITAKEYQDGVKPLIDNDFFILVSGVLAERKQSAIPETEGEREKEAKRETEAPEGVSLEVWDSFVKQRKARKAQITERVMNSIKEQAKIAGWTLENALSEIVIRNWQTFKSDWVAVKPNPADIGRITVAPSNLPDPALEKIKADDKKAAPIPFEVLAKMAELRRKA
tara:strand:+ start:75 stop:788 length:714 start_codon:yes stop_codon:yes gene_type:complete